MSSRRRFLRHSAVLVGAASFAARGRAAQDPDPEFDVIIVGAGSSGCVLANRLSRDPATRVLLVEAGGSDASPAIQTPGRWTTLMASAVDWNDQTEPEPGLDGRAIAWPRGKVIGGSSAINAMAHVRGHQLTFARWAAAAGASWGYREVLSLFRAAEDNTRGATDYLGAGGPMAVADTTDPHAGHLAFLEGAREVGFAADPRWDFNGRQQENGAGFYQKTIRDGRRESAATAFLAPVLTRPNLVVWSNTLARRVLFAGTRATGLECVRDGRAARARATRGVVLAAGAVASPKLLMLSGVGPADAVRRAGIAVVADRAEVGANLQDHPRVSVRWQGRAPLAGSSVSAGLLTWSSRGPIPTPPDIQFYVGRGIPDPDPFVTLTIALSVPRSRGSIALRSSDPLAPPVIRANYFQDARDLDAMAEGVRLARAIAHARAYDAIRGDAIDPPAGADASAVRAFIRRTAGTMFHPAGTCRMGTDAASVVDPQLRVRGVDGLWVVDASVMPEVVNCQTHAACVMIALRAGELIGGRGSFPQNRP
jgi:choline dehydrogenase